MPRRYVARVERLGEALDALAATERFCPELRRRLNASRPDPWGVPGGAVPTKKTRPYYKPRQIEEATTWTLDRRDFDAAALNRSAARLRALLAPDYACFGDVL